MWIVVRRLVLVFVFVATLISGYFVPFWFIEDESTTKTNLALSNGETNRERATVVLSPGQFFVPAQGSTPVSIYIDTKQSPLEAFKFQLRTETNFVDVPQIEGTLANYQYTSYYNAEKGIVTIEGRVKQSQFGPQPVLGELARFVLQTKDQQGTASLYFDIDSYVFGNGRSFLGEARGVEIKITK